MSLVLYYSQAKSHNTNGKLRAAKGTFESSSLSSSSPGDFASWTSAGEPAPVRKTSNHRQFGQCRQASSRAEQRQDRGAGENRRETTFGIEQAPIPPAFSRASVLPLRGASRRSTGAAGRPGTAAGGIQSARGSHSDCRPTQHRGLLLCSFLLRRKRVFPSSFAEIHPSHHGP